MNIQVYVRVRCVLYARMLFCIFSIIISMVGAYKCVPEVWYFIDFILLLTHLYAYFILICFVHSKHEHHNSKAIQSIVYNCATINFFSLLQSVFLPLCKQKWIHSKQMKTIHSSNYWFWFFVCRCSFTNACLLCMCDIRYKVVFELPLYWYNTA